MTTPKPRRARRLLDTVLISKKSCFCLTSPKPRKARRLLETVLISKMSCFFDLAEAPQGAPLTRNSAYFQELVFFLTSPKPRRARRLLETVLISNNPYNPYNPYNLICHEAAPEQRYRTFDNCVLREISLRIFGLLGDFDMTFRHFSTFSKIVREPFPNTFPSKPSRSHASKVPNLDFLKTRDLYLIV